MSFQTYIQNWTSGLCPPICESYSFIHVGKWQNPAICSGQKLWCPPGYHTCSVRQSCSFCFQSTNDFSPFHCYHVGLSHHHLQLRLFQWSPLQSISPIMASPSLQNTLNKRATITCYIRSFCSFSQNHPMPFIFPPLSQWPLSCHSTYALTISFYCTLISFRPLLRCHLFITDVYNQPNWNYTYFPLSMLLNYVFFHTI